MGFVNAFSAARLTAFSVLFSAAACGLVSCKREGRRLKEAYRQSYEYTTMFDRRTRRSRLRAELPKEVFRAEEIQEGAGRVKLDMDIYVPFGIEPGAVRATLKELATKAMGVGGYRAVRARAFYEGLVHFGGPVGTYVLSKDGSGWDGTVSGYRVTSVHLPRLARNDYEILKTVEVVWRELRARARRKNPRRIEEQAVAEAARRLGLTERSVAETVARARARFAESGSRPRTRRQ